MSAREEYKKALLACRNQISEAQLKMLTAHYKADHHAITATQLAKAARYPSFASANLHYGLLGKEIGRHLSIEPGRRSNGTPVWTTILAEGDPEKAKDEHYQWVMQPALVQALEELPWGMKAK